MDLMARHRMIGGMAHPVTETGGVVTFETDIAGAISVTGEGNITVAGRNLYNYVDRKTGYFINASGAEQASTTVWTITPYIKVEGLAKITYFGLSTAGVNPRSAWYDGNKQLLSVWKQATGRNTITVPSGAVYMRMSAMGSSTGDEYNLNVMPGETNATAEFYIGTSSLVSHSGYNTVWSDEPGEITVTYWTT